MFMELMVKQKMAVRLLLVLMLSIFTQAQYSDFAVEVVDAQGNFSDAGFYKNPVAMLGKPTLNCRTGSLPEPTYRVKLVQPAFNRSDTGEKVVTTIDPGEYVVVKFDHPVVDFPGNPFGQDLIVFGNAYFFTTTTTYVDDAQNINFLELTTPAAAYVEAVAVSVSQDGQTWHTFDNGPWADDLYPTQAYQWDRQTAQWTDIEMDFTHPVDPNLSLAAFNGLSVADAIDLYDGSGGGTPYDLQDLPQYDQLIPDPNSGYRWIQYVRLEGGEGIYALGGEVDAVADVAVCGDPTHPVPPGDITGDCRVNLEDFAVLAENWLTCTYRCDR
jgi:hypothetical protein